MAKNKKPEKKINQAAATCEISKDFAERLASEKIDMPEGIVLHARETGRRLKIEATHPLCDFYQDVAYWMETISQTVDTMTVQALRDFANGTRTSLRNQQTIASMDLAFGISDAIEAMNPNLVDSLNLEAVGFDVVFVRLAEQAGVTQDELEAAVAKVIENIRQQENDKHYVPRHARTPRNQVTNVLKQGFSNRTSQELVNLFGTRYRNMNTDYAPVLQKLPAFNGCIWGSKPLSTDVMIGDWLYRSSQTPTMISGISIPHTLKMNYKGRPANDLIDTPMFGESQKVIHIADLKNGKTSITLTGETKPFRSKRIAC